ncbi:MAG: hypothetical protein R8G34_05870 [Paracoccaceae bacterium]|nr:hypothetical protein [Paracoccaceae bacterium]
MTFQSLSDNQGDRLVPHKWLSLRAVFFIAIANRRMKDLLAFLNARGYFVDNLTAILFPL